MTTPAQTLPFPDRPDAPPPGVQGPDTPNAGGSAGICAFDLDECTATIAFDTAAEMQAFISRLPGRKRIRVMKDDGEDDRLGQQAWLLRSATRLAVALLAEHCLRDNRAVTTGDLIHLYESLGYREGPVEVFLNGLVRTFSLLSGTTRGRVSAATTIPLGEPGPAITRLLVKYDLYGSIEATGPDQPAMLVLREIGEGDPVVAFPAETPIDALEAALQFHQRGVRQGQSNGAQMLSDRIARELGLASIGRLQALEAQVERLGGR